MTIIVAGAYVMSATITTETYHLMDMKTIGQKVLSLLNPTAAPDLETPAWMNKVWSLLGAKAMTIKPVGKFYKNGNKKKCVIVHENVHWTDIPNPFGATPKHNVVNWAVWYATYFAEHLTRFVLNGFRPYHPARHSKELDAYIAEWGCQDA